MISEDGLRDIMLEVHGIEFGVIGDLPDFKPSLRHRLAMKRIFARFERNICKFKNAATIRESPETEYKTIRYNLKQRILTAALVIILMTLLAGCVNAVVKFVSEHFNGTVYEDNTQLFAADLENCPQTIEYQYVLTNVPDGFELIKTVSSPTNIYTLYMNSTTGQRIVFRQWIKTNFAPHYNTEKGTFEEIDINGTTGLYIDFGVNGKNNSILIWDNGDYIIEILADLDKNSALKLLDIAKL